MKVNNVSNVYFKGSNYTSKPEITPQNNKEIKELGAVTPDYYIKMPTKYSKIGEYNLGNNLKIHKYKLANGHQVTIIPMKNSPSIVKNYVNVGSMNETEDIKGISHFLEHMAFNGTNGENGHIKLNTGDSFKKIEALGGWANASTNYAITDYVNSTPLLNETDVNKQIEIIGAMTEDLKLSNEMIEKEKHPVSSEINMILDDPQTIALDQTVRTLFNIKNSADELVGGSVKTVKNLTRKDILDYYNKYYTPDNMNLVITGDVNPDEIIQTVSKNFNSRKISQGRKYEEKLIPLNKTIRKDFINDKTNSCDIVIAFAGPKRNDSRGQVIDDIAKMYLQSHSVGLKQNLKKYNTYAYISDEIISTNKQNPLMNYIATNTSENNSENVLKSIFTSLHNVKEPSQKDLNIIKEKILEIRDNTYEYSNDVNSMVGYSILNNTPELLTDYENIINSITPKEVIKHIHKHYNIEKAAVTLVHPKKKESNITFTGKRQPINEENISEIKLDNNFDIGLHETKNKNLSYNIMLVTDKPYNKKAGVVEVLDEIYGMGTINKNENDYTKFKEENNIRTYGSVSSDAIEINTNGNYKKSNLIFDNAKELLYEPRFTEEDLVKAKENIKDYYARNKDNANSLYSNYDSLNDPYSFSDDEILKNIDSITLDDVKDCHKYLLENSRGIITANVPIEKPEIQNKITSAAMKLNQVLPNKKNNINIYKPNNKSIVLTKASNNSQADVKQIFKFKVGESIEENLKLNLINSILSSSSIGLFDNLREKEHLAYSVYSDFYKNNDLGEISCNILTTTDNKEINEYSYDNIQKSINGFNQQIQALLNGEFTDQDLDNAKLTLKAALINNEGTNSKLMNLKMGLNSQYGITLTNQIYEKIDNITREDIINEATKAFSNPPIYSIVASQDTLDYNKDFLKQLEK